MITREQAREWVEADFCRRQDWPPDDELIIVDESTIERPWGWVFFYTSRRWFETNDLRYAVAGNAPVIVEKATGKMMVTGTAHGIEFYIDNYEKTGDPHG